jgi:putative FmdB family regulatory protein
MPLYEYECDACGHRFEKIQRFSDAPVENCPKCGGPVHKVLSSPAIQFKGSGWYITDYAKKEGAKDAKADSVDAKDAKAGADAKDTKAAATETKDAAPAKDRPAKKDTKSADAKST